MTSRRAAKLKKSFVLIPMEAISFYIALPSARNGPNAKAIIARFEYMDTAFSKKIDINA
ncbi:MAG: hypothetical protein OEV92_13575 [Nitrospinota bacterium]|nr:hypothetical protein [Nitrospinota bacterium]